MVVDRMCGGLTTLAVMSNFFGDQARSRSRSRIDTEIAVRMIYHGDEAPTSRQIRPSLSVRGYSRPPTPHSYCRGMRCDKANGIEVPVRQMAFGIRIGPVLMGQGFKRGGILSHAHGALRCCTLTLPPWRRRNLPLCTDNNGNDKH